jgi:hypothetical protein
MGRSRIPGGVKNQFQVPFEKRTAQRQSQASSAKILHYATRTAESGSGLTWGDNGDNITVTVAVASGVATKPSEIMGYLLWDTGYTVADLPALQMHLLRVTSPEAQTTGPPCTVYGYVVKDAAGNVDFTNSVSRWGGVVWGVGSNGENNDLSSRLRANQTFGYSGNRALDSSAPTNYGYQQWTRFLMKQHIPNSSGTAGDYIFSLTNQASNYPATGGGGASQAEVRDLNESGAMTGTDKIFAFLGVFRRTNVGSGTVDLAFKLTDFSLKA